MAKIIGHVNIEWDSYGAATKEHNKSLKAAAKRAKKQNKAYRGDQRRLRSRLSRSGVLFSLIDEETQRRVIEMKKYASK